MLHANLLEIDYSHYSKWESLSITILLPQYSGIYEINDYRHQEITAGDFRSQQRAWTVETRNSIRTTSRMTPSQIHESVQIVNVYVCLLRTQKDLLGDAYTTEVAASG